MAERWSRRRFLATSGAGLAATALAACATQQAPQVVEREVTRIVEGTPQVVKETVVVEKMVTAERAADEIVHIKYLEFPSRDLNGITRLCNQYSEERDGKIVVDVVISPDSVYEKLTMMHMAGDPADLTQWGLNIIDLAVRDIVLKLDDYLDRDGINLEEEFSPTSLGACHYTTWGLNGYYGVPLYINLVYIAYNKALLEEAGVPLPPTKVADAWTCEEFTNYAMSMTDANGMRWGCTDMDFGWYNVPTLFGGFSFTEGGTEVLWDERAYMAFQWISDLLWQYQCAPTSEQVEMLGGGQIFLTGQVAMAQASGWQLPAYREIEDFEWGIGVLPYSNDTVPYRAGRLMPNVWVIDSTSKYRDEAWDFIKWMTMDPEHNVEQCKVYGSTSPSIEGLPLLMQWYEEQFGIDTEPLVELLNNSAITGDNWWDNPNWADSQNETELTARWDELKLGRLSGEEFGKIVAPQLEEVLNREYAGRTAAG